MSWCVTGPAIQVDSGHVHDIRCIDRAGGAPLADADIVEPGARLFVGSGGKLYQSMGCPDGMAGWAVPFAAGALLGYLLGR